MRVSARTGSNRRKPQPKHTAVIRSADFAFDLQFGAVALGYVLDDGEAETGAAGFA